MRRTNPTLISAPPNPHNSANSFPHPPQLIHLQTLITHGRPFWLVTWREVGFPDRLFKSQRVSPRAVGCWGGCWERTERWAEDSSFVPEPRLRCAHPALAHKRPLDVNLPDSATPPATTMSSPLSWSCLFVNYRNTSKGWTTLSWQSTPRMKRSSALLLPIARNGCRPMNSRLSIALSNWLPIWLPSLTLTPLPLWGSMIHASASCSTDSRRSNAWGRKGWCAGGIGWQGSPKICTIWWTTTAWLLKGSGKSMSSTTSGDIRCLIRTIRWIGRIRSALPWCSLENLGATWVSKQGKFNLRRPTAKVGEIAKGPSIDLHLNLHLHSLHLSNRWCHTNINA